MNRLITAYVADTSACPKRQAVFYLREAMSHAQTRQMTADVSSHTSDGSWIGSQTAESSLLTAERRDIELKRKRKRDGGMAINRTKESRIMKKIFKDHGYESLLPSWEASQDIGRKNESE